MPNPFLAAILAAPADDTVRLAYADYLDETFPGDKMMTVRAAFVRWQVRGDGIPYGRGQPPWNVCWFADKRHLWRTDGKLARAVYAAAGNGDYGHPRFGNYSWDLDKVIERGLWTQTAGDYTVRLTYHRGFVHAVTTPLTPAGLALVRVVAAGHPVARVDVPSRTPHRLEITGWWTWRFDADCYHQPDASALPWALHVRREPHVFETETAARDWLSDRIIAWARESEPAGGATP